MQGIAVMIRIPVETSMQKIGNTFSSGFVANWLCILALGCQVFGHLIWVLERSKPVHSSHMPAHSSYMPAHCSHVRAAWQATTVLMGKMYQCSLKASVEGGMRGCGGRW